MKKLLILAFVVYMCLPLLANDESRSEIPQQLQFLGSYFYSPVDVSNLGWTIEDCVDIDNLRGLRPYNLDNIVATNLQQILKDCMADVRSKHHDCGEDVVLDISSVTMSRLDVKGDELWICIAEVELKRKTEDGVVMVDVEPEIFFLNGRIVNPPPNGYQAMLRGIGFDGDAISQELKTPNYCLVFFVISLFSLFANVCVVFWNRRKLNLCFVVTMTICLLIVMIFAVIAAARIFASRIPIVDTSLLN